MKILVVDDDKNFRQISTEYYRHNGRVDTVADGQDAISRARSTRYDLVLVDLVLPGPLIGLEVISKLRAMSTSVHIIACTDYISQNLQAKAIQAGANEFKMKKILTDKFSKSKENKSTAKKLEFIPDIFANIPNDQARQILDMSKTVMLDAKQTLKINLSKELIIIQSGQASYRFKNCVIGTLHKGNVVGETINMLDYGLSSHAIEAKTNTLILVIDKIQLKKFLGSSKQVAFIYTVNTSKSLSIKLAKSHEIIFKLSQQLKQVKSQLKDNLVVDVKKNVPFN
jgi:CheY-like chemotaxis protein